MGGSSQDRSSTTGTLEEIDSLDAPVELVRRRRGLDVRWSQGPEEDGEECSCDHASGLELPRLAANPLDPPGRWTLPEDAWVARQVTTYDHLGQDQADHVAWVLCGRMVDGPDNEPLVVDVRPVACLAPVVLDEAVERAPRSDRERDDDASAERESVVGRLRVRTVALDRRGDWRRRRAPCPKLSTAYTPAAAAVWIRLVVERPSTRGMSTT